MDGGPVGPGRHDVGLAHVQVLDDVVPDRGRGRRRQSEYRRAAQPFGGLAQVQVVGAEVVSPGGDAVGLVHDEQRGPSSRSCSTTLSLVSCSGDKNRYSASPSRIARQPLWVAERGCAEFTATASGAALSRRPATWSRCRAISGDTTRCPSLGPAGNPRWPPLSREPRTPPRRTPAPRACVMS